ncbi:CPBP family intramembrane glutamic endopeptidase [Kitasatospora sp. NPDC059795]|uniref:CPBP family intramembrane glutamic endopeptidase n=1 Tax=Kitasatospora sp. NPDC059795 TaxID=3346949 RepID=UPI00365199BF
MQEERPSWLGPAGLFLTVSFVASGLLLVVQPFTGLPGEVLELVQFGPAVGVAAVALVRPSLVRGLLAGGGARGPRAAVLLSPLAIAALAVAGTLLLHGSVPMRSPGSLAAPFGVVAVAQFVGACGEEIGWRCLLQPLLRTRFGALGSSVAVGLLWGAWHVQVFAQAPAYAAGFLAATVAMSVLLGLAWERIGAHRLLVAGGFHTLMNLGMLLFLDEESGAVEPMVLFGVASALVALPWVLAARRPARTDRLATT